MDREAAEPHVLTSLMSSSQKFTLGFACSLLKFVFLMLAQSWVHGHRPINCMKGLCWVCRWSCGRLKVDDIAPILAPLRDRLPEAGDENHHFELGTVLPR